MKDFNPERRDRSRTRAGGERTRASAWRCASREMTKAPDRRGADRDRARTQARGASGQGQGPHPRGAQRGDDKRPEPGREQAERGQKPSLDGHRLGEDKDRRVRAHRQR